MDLTHPIHQFVLEMEIAHQTIFVRVRPTGMVWIVQFQLALESIQQIQVYAQEEETVLL